MIYLGIESVSFIAGDHSYDFGYSRAAAQNDYLSYSYIVPANSVLNT